MQKKLSIVVVSAMVGLLFSAPWQLSYGVDSDAEIVDYDDANWADDDS